MSACPKCDDDTFYDLHCSRCGFDTAELLVAERDAARAEVERLRERLQFDPGGSDKIDELEQAALMLRAEVERLTRERDEAIERAHRSGLLFDDARKQTTEALADIERLREALRGSLSHSHEDGRCALCDKARAALAGAPSETRREQGEVGPCDDCGKPAGIRVCTGCWPHKLIIAEKVREACVKALWRRPMKRTKDRALVVLMESELRALDLDALLKEKK